MIKTRDQSILAQFCISYGNRYESIGLQYVLKVNSEDARRTPVYVVLRSLSPTLNIFNSIC